MSHTSPPTNQRGNSKLINALVANQVISFHIFGLVKKLSGIKQTRILQEKRKYYFSQDDILG